MGKPLCKTALNQTAPKAAIAHQAADLRAHHMNKQTTRRGFVTGSIAGAAVLTPVLAPTLARATTADLAPQRHLTFSHTHTGETLSVLYADRGSYVPEALQSVNHLLRDFRSNQVYPMDPGLLDALWRLRDVLGSTAPVEVVSGYRSPATNEQLRRQSANVAEHSLHMDGRAVDLRLPGTELETVRRAARALALGGVGYYPRSDFVHLDTGRVRFW
jgi:uncharacterized protein YcbK (DUF882 family)